MGIWYNNYQLNALRLRFIYYIQNMRYKAILLMFMVVALSVSAQFSVPKVGNWRVHLPYQTNNTVAQNGSIIYAGSSSGVFSFDVEDNSLDVMSKVTGLSDVEVKKLEFDNRTQTLVIVYNNTNIDLLQNGRITNIPDLLRKTIIGDKLVNDVTVVDGVAYLACSFGIVKIDLQRKQIIDSYQNIGIGGSNLPVNDVAVYNGSLYASSNKGLYRASLNSGNLSDFNFWSEVRTDTCNHLLAVGGFLIASTANSENVLRRFDGVVWDTLTGLSNQFVKNIRMSAQKLMCIQDKQVLTYDAQFTPTVFAISGALDGVINTDGNYSLAVVEQGLVLFEPNGNRYLAPAGAWGNTALKFSYSSTRKQLFVAGGMVDGVGAATGLRSTGNNNKYYVFDGNMWYNSAVINNPLVNRCRDFMDVFTDDKTGKTYLTSFGFGLLEVNNLTPTTLYDTSNSSIGFFVTAFPTFRPVYASGTTVDNAGNLWVTSYGAAKPLAVKTPSNQWYSFAFSGGDANVSYMVCDNAFPRNNKWIINNRAGGLYVYNEGANIASNTDDRFRILGKEKGNGLLPSTNVLSMALDKNGEMWIGTDQGLCIISDPTAVFSNSSTRSFDARQLIINTGSFNSIILGTDAILCIKVDGANRKWIGTRNGVWLLSEDGYTVIRNFTTENSPLLSNVVYDIGIFEETGEVFFATEKGIISYAGDATKADAIHGKVVVYPNPVRPEYTGEIAIRGLAENTNVKITDIAGNLVYETKANGGMATWNGRNFSGKRAATGVYLIYSSNDDATETYVTKLLFVN